MLAAAARSTTYVRLGWLGDRLGINKSAIFVNKLSKHGVEAVNLFSDDQTSGISKYISV